MFIVIMNAYTLLLTFYRVHNEIIINPSNLRRGVFIYTYLKKTLLQKWRPRWDPAFHSKTKPGGDFPSDAHCQ